MLVSLLIFSLPPSSAALVLSHNNLSDMSARLLSHIVRRTASLRLLDLRSNTFSKDGEQLLLDALKDNPSVSKVSGAPPRARSDVILECFP
jgi:Leucine-rich repeat (LRR) protein